MKRESVWKTKDPCLDRENITPSQDDANFAVT